MRKAWDYLSVILAVCLAWFAMFHFGNTNKYQRSHLSQGSEDFDWHNISNTLVRPLMKIPPYLSYVIKEEQISPFFPFFVSAQKFSSISLKLTKFEEISDEQNPKPPSNRNEKKIHIPYSSSDHKSREMLHPPFISSGDSDELVVLTDLEWKEQVRIQIARQELEGFELNHKSRKKVSFGLNEDMYYNTNRYDTESFDVIMEEYENVDLPKYFDNYSESKLRKELVYHKNHDGKWSEQAVLEIFFDAMGLKSTSSSSLPSSNQENVPTTNIPHADKHWLEEGTHICSWTGIICGIQTHGECNSDKSDIPCSSITQIHLPNSNLKGSLPSELSHLNNLHRLNLNGNQIYGSIPTYFAKLYNLQYLDIGNNQLSGTIPSYFFNRLIHLEELWLQSNSLVGTIPDELFDLNLVELDAEGNQFRKKLNILDLSWNMFLGTISSEFYKLCQTSRIETLFLEGNMITGTIPTTLGLCKSLQRLDLNSNQIDGTVPTELGQLQSLDMLLLSNNKMEGTIPTQLFRLSELQTLVLSGNKFSGTLPQYLWRGMVQLKNLSFSNNQLSGTLPTTLGGLPRIHYLDLHNNLIIGTVPTEIGNCREIMILDLSSNQFTGNIPSEVGNVEMLMILNITSNLVTGTVPDSLCNNLLINNGNTESHGCRAIACPPGFYSHTGASSNNDKCRECKSKNVDKKDIYKHVLGRTSCNISPITTSSSSSVAHKKQYKYRAEAKDTSKLPVGDVDGDGKISQREILRLLYLYTNMGEFGYGWDFDVSSAWHSWRDLKVHECDLPGIVCRNGDVVNIQLEDVHLCNEKFKKGPGSKKANAVCLGLPTELGLLHYLEVLNLSSSPGLQGNIPSELGQLQHLKELHLSHSNMAGSIPSELGNAKSLKNLNLPDAGLEGSIPAEISNLAHLEKLNLSLNFFTGSIPESFGKLNQIKEILISRCELNGTIPDSMGNLSNLENLELYGNNIEGPLPASLAQCPYLMRLDVFNNRMTGTIPPRLTRIPLLQIAHLKANLFTGTIPSGLGNHPLLSWLDVSSNHLRGTIPTSFGESRSLKDLRFGGNQLQGPIPEILCNNERINGGRTSSFGCDAIACPVGFFSADNGFASSDSPCKQCPNDETTLYIGSTKCYKYTQRDYLKIFYDMMKGDDWEKKFNKDWKDDGISECDWAGVSCDDDGHINGLSFPVSASSLSQQ